MRFWLFFSTLLSLLCPNDSEAQTKNTNFAPTLLTEIDGKNNIVYCATMELLWLDLSSYLGGPFKSRTTNDKIKQLIASIENYEIPLDSAFWFTEIGRIEDGVNDSIQKQFLTKFQRTWQPEYTQENGIIGFTYLQKNVEFKREFSDEAPLKFSNSTHVLGFGQQSGSSNPEDQKHLIIHDYIDAHNFIFQIVCKDSLDEIYFAMVPNGPDLLTTYDSAMARIGLKTTYLHQYDQLQIPFLKFDETTQFTDTTGQELTTEHNEQVQLTRLSQKIVFDLNMKGIILESEARSIMTLFESCCPRIYAFDQPFLIVMKRRESSHPYFLYWVQNTEHMRVINN